MPGPQPKPAALRQRRNKHTTARRFEADDAAFLDTPPQLPQDRNWHPQTLEFWYTLWASPMADEYLQLDLNGLLRFAVLVDEFWQTEETNQKLKLSSELRLLSQQYGTSPLDRRRLQWEVARVEQAESKRPKSSPTVGTHDDPRSILNGNGTKR